MVGGPRAGGNAVGRGLLALSGDRPTLLVLRALGLGDVLTGVPALRALRRALPDHELVLAAPAAFTPLVRLTGVVDRLVDHAGLAPLPWAGPAPDTAVNLHGRGPQSHRLLAALRPSRLVAFDCPAAGVTGPAWRVDEHEVARWSRLVEEVLGEPADPADLLLHRPAAAPLVEDAVVVHPGAADPSRRWPPDRFAAVARALTDAGHSVVVTGSAAEVPLTEEVRRAAGLSPDAVLAGRTDLEQLAAVVASARLVVCGDTGTAHLASAYRTPSVVLFGPVSPALWGPPGLPEHTVIWHGDGTGDPWAEGPDPALLRVTADEVVAAAAQLLSGPGLDGPGLDGPGRRTTRGSA